MRVRKHYCHRKEGVSKILKGKGTTEKLKWHTSTPRPKTDDPQGIRNLDSSTIEDKQ